MMSPRSGRQPDALSPVSRAPLFVCLANLGLTPQALCCHPLRGLYSFIYRTWGLRMLSPALRALFIYLSYLGLVRPRLYAGTCSAGSIHLFIVPGACAPRLYAVTRFAGSIHLFIVPGACAPGFMLSPALRALEPR